MVRSDWIVEHYHYAKIDFKLAIYSSTGNEETARVLSTNQKLVLDFSKSLTLTDDHKLLMGTRRHRYFSIGGLTSNGTYSDWTFVLP